MPPDATRPFSQHLSAASREFDHLISHIDQRAPQSDDFYQITAQIADVLAQAYRDDPAWRQTLDRNTAPSSAIVQASLRYAREVPPNQHTVDDLARTLGVSASHLRRHLHTHLGISPHALLNRQRMQRACILLRSQPDSLATIAAACGFDDQHYFSRWFRKHLAVTPSQYRRGMQR